MCLVILFCLQETGLTLNIQMCKFLKEDSCSQDTLLTLKGFLPIPKNQEPLAIFQLSRIKQNYRSGSVWKVQPSIGWPEWTLLPTASRIQLVIGETFNRQQSCNPNLHHIMSKSLSHAEKNYLVIEKEMLATNGQCESLEEYVLGQLQ